MNYCSYALVLISCLIGPCASAQSGQPVPWLTKEGTYRFLHGDRLQPAFPEAYMQALPFREGLSLVGSEEKSWYINPAGKKAFSKTFTEATPFQEGRAIVYEKNKSGLLTPEGQVIPVPYELHQSGIGEGLCVATDPASGKSGYISLTDGKLVIPPAFDFARPFSEGKAAVLQQQQWGFINREGRMALPARFEAAMHFTGGLAGVKAGGKWGFIDTAGVFAIAPQYDNVTPFAAGRAFGLADGHWYLIDAKGIRLKSLPYKMAVTFSEGLAAVMTMDGLWGYINPAGELVIAPKYVRAGAFVNGLALVTTGEPHFYIDARGTEYRER